MSHPCGNVRFYTKFSHSGTIHLFLIGVRMQWSRNTFLTGKEKWYYCCDLIRRTNWIISVWETHYIIVGAYGYGYISVRTICLKANPSVLVSHRLQRITYICIMHIMCTITQKLGWQNVNRVLKQLCWIQNNLPTVGYCKSVCFIVCDLMTYGDKSWWDVLCTSSSKHLCPNSQLTCKSVPLVVG